MDAIKVLLVDDNESSRLLMKVFLGDKADVHVVGEASDGLDAFNLTVEFEPDVVILDIVMPTNDGIYYLERLRTLPRPHPNVIMLTAMMREDILLQAMQMGASYYMLKPVEYEILYQRIVMYAPRRKGEYAVVPAEKSAPISSVKRSAQESIEQILSGSGFPAHVQGYRYLVEAVKLVQADKSLINNITKGLYPMVAKRCAASTTQVERLIRHAIALGWQRDCATKLNEHFGSGALSSSKKPTNGELIALLASWIDR